MISPSCSNERGERTAASHRGVFGSSSSCCAKGGDPRSLPTLSPLEVGRRDELAHLCRAAGGAKGERRSRPSPR
ncbi:unnamed protein product [Spirodela intermedia]|uniref:Uncharacterized protein n=1 Tax=Spirodela intermedia TaxID=51605 RepID=A0A7I8J250_SPIIN|nr:unnamed protein product [Spirodela intermedia]CAA2624874.1 unnamed protein product [Spirodela intermedia]CAA6662069.1 unnamed protein product [Spirodela intermedia]CAA6664296.1 unnamed protein product [Spirodela intermedia]CAA6674214.1 unnamed protein product [Spirodela intermedia]